MTDATLSAAIQEAYASAPVDEVIYHTLELHHPAFSTPIRVVRGWEDVNATLEATAPEDPSTLVTFVAFPFEFIKPEVTPNGVPQIIIEIDNVSREILAAIESTVGSTAQIQVIYREYIDSDLSGPQNDPPLLLTIYQVTADPFRVRATAGFADLGNTRFPREEYTAETFPGLVPV
jgi:hypothetical protein